MMENVIKIFDELTDTIVVIDRFERIYIVYHVGKGATTVNHLSSSGRIAAELIKLKRSIHRFCFVKKKCR
jgi:hypothetical protein